MVPLLVQVALDGLAYIYLSPLNLFSMLSLHYEKLYMIVCLIKVHVLNKPLDKNKFYYLLNKIYVVGTQKNCFNEMFLLNTQN